MIKSKESEEMYLETILRLSAKKSCVHSIDVAAELGYSKPSVSRAVGLLKNKDYITVAADGEIKLTPRGKTKANAVFERHKALTAALTYVGLDEKEAEENACRIEHVITDKAFEAIKAFVSKEN